ncbi:SAG family member [Eimeria brunetti]|uniref:SAG family member n=1 Tax=Eimeria brunetti TaxID=51314 RepID=U6LAP6_9EIME|nr:SAG family member [Eimeria brunetti]
MASLYRAAAAVCLVALYGIQSEATGKIVTYQFKSENVDDACYLAANLARNGKLPVHISEVEHGDSIVSSLTEKVESKTIKKEGDTVSDPGCNELMEESKLVSTASAGGDNLASFGDRALAPAAALSHKDIFHYTFEYKEKPNYPELLQAALDADGYLAANLVRNGKLPVHVNEVAKDDNIVSTLTGTVNSTEHEETGEEAEVTIDDTCTALVKKGKLTDIFHYTFTYQEKPNYRELFQAALDAGLAIFKNPDYQNKWDAIWENDAGGSLAYLLGANSTTIGCVVAQCTATKSAASGKNLPETTKGKALLLCKLNPEAEKNQAPFDDAYFDGLIARTAKLADMTEEDLKAATNDGTTAAALPTILTASFVAMVAVASA